MSHLRYITSSRVVFGDGIGPATIEVSDGKIVSIGPDVRIPQDAPAASVTDFGDLVISPGLVDIHVHINEPGRTEWEGFETATRAAAAGGVTTLVDMPLNSVPTTISAEALDAKRSAAGGQCHVDVGFWGGVVPGNERQLEGLAAGGVCGFKCFLAPSGIDEFPPVDEQDLYRALPVIAQHGLPLLVHAESPAILMRAGRTARAPRSYAAYLATRPPAAELEAVRLMIRLARKFGVATHIVHVAAAEAVAEIARARSASVPITAE